MIGQIEKSSSASDLARSITAGEMHVSGDQSKIRRKDSKGLKVSRLASENADVADYLSPISFISITILAVPS
jgi:hypothetical protein